jgi:hypothetical protein
MLWCPFYPRERGLCVKVAPCVSVWASFCWASASPCGYTEAPTERDITYRNRRANFSITSAKVRCSYLYHIGRHWAVRIITGLLWAMGQAFGGIGLLRFLEQVKSGFLSDRALGGIWAFLFIIVLLWFFYKVLLATCAGSTSHSVELQRHLAVILKRRLSVHIWAFFYWYIIYSARSTTHVTRWFITTSLFPSESAVPASSSTDNNHIVDIVVVVAYTVHGR